MTEPKEPLKSFVTSQYIEDRYRKEASGQKTKAMGASDLIMRMYRKESDDNPSN